MLKDVEALKPFKDEDYLALCLKRTMRMSHLDHKTRKLILCKQIVIFFLRTVQNTHSQYMHIMDRLYNCCDIKPDGT
jgi:hypothetical protein